MPGMLVQEGTGYMLFGSLFILPFALSLVKIIAINFNIVYCNISWLKIRAYINNDDRECYWENEPTTNNAQYT
jgi:hypothetical protein